ncbi:FAD-dependent oxidoreductase [bacterium]|nr:FAD-dependent oxidoreductase [bacterium]
MTLGCVILAQEKAAELAATDRRELRFREDSSNWLLSETGQPPCNAACPAGVNAKAYVSLIAEGRFDEALAVVRERLPMPGVIGRICSRPCESECVRGQFDDPIAICALKRFVGDYDLRVGTHRATHNSPKRKEKVAVIGAGPCGLTAALNLARQGFCTTIFDLFGRPGGMLLAGIPSFRLPRDILAYEIDDILRSGIELKRSICVGQDVGITELFDQGYKAVLIASGAHKGMRLRVPGDDLDGVIDAISFLNGVNLHGKKEVGKRVVIIGGGDSAIDSARTALRLGAEEVRILYRRSRTEMPARDYEIDEALQEGIKIDLLVAPVRVHGLDGQVSAIELTRMQLGEPDESGRRRPIPIKGSEFNLACDTVIGALGQKPDLTVTEGLSGLETTSWGTIQADDPTCATSIPGLFAAGDVVTGAATAVEAIGAAHRASMGMATFIESGTPSILGKLRRSVPVKFEIISEPQVRASRVKVPVVNAANRASNFDEVEKAYSTKAAKEEASRCLLCGDCLACKLCASECEGRYVAMLPDLQDRGAAWVKAELLKVPMALRDELVADGPKSAALMDRDGKEHRKTIVQITAAQDELVCIGCGLCEEMCGYCAIRITYSRERGAFVPTIETAYCRGCGSCIANCPTGALDQSHFSNGHLQERILSAKETIVISCIWEKSRRPDEYAALQDRLGENACFVDLMCAGRLPMWLLLEALERGAKRLIILGCDDDECRYGSSDRVREAISRIKTVLQMLGSDPDRIVMMNFSER